MASLQEDQTDLKDNGSDRKNNERVDTRQPENRNRSKRVRLILFAVLILAVIAAIPLFNYYASRESTDDAQVDGHVVPISPRINGTVISVLVNDNQYVTAGT